MKKKKFNNVELQDLPKIFTHCKFMKSSLNVGISFKNI